MFIKLKNAVKQYGQGEAAESGNSWSYYKKIR